MKKTFDVHYYDGHSAEAHHAYSETWEPADVFCPVCGKHSVWHDTSPGDYYVEEQYLCLECESSFHLPCFGRMENGETHKPESNNGQRIKALRE